jgi:Mn2+/Fe2+ NRAMP family transporter
MNDSPPKPRRFAFLAVLGPGILVAATGVGAGDLLTASYAGSRHGLVLLWAAWLGAVLTLIIIGSRVQLEKGPSMALELAGQLGGTLGAPGKWIFLAGFWGAVFSSLLGVWQSAPYFFADFLMLGRGRNTSRLEGMDLAGTQPYRVYLFLIAFVPLPLLWLSVPVGVDAAAAEQPGGVDRQRLP